PVHPPARVSQEPRMRHPRTNPRPGRRAAATVELAAVVPLLGLLAVGMIEVTRAIQVRHYLSDVARSACRLAILPGSSNAQVTATVNQELTAFGIHASYATVSFRVNGVPADVATATQGDTVSVKVGVPVSKVSWLTPFIFTTQSIESETLVMMRQL